MPTVGLESFRSIVREPAIDAAINGNLVADTVDLDSAGNMTINGSVRTLTATDGQSGNISINVTNSNSLSGSGTVITGAADDSVTGNTFGISSGSIFLDVAGSVDQVS